MSSMCSSINTTTSVYVHCYSWGDVWDDVKDSAGNWVSELAKQTYNPRAKSLIVAKMCNKHNGNVV